MHSTLWLPDHLLLGIDMVTAAEHRSLEEAANQYLSDQDFGVPEVEAVMSKVFGESRTGIEAVA